MSKLLLLTGSRNAELVAIGPEDVDLIGLRALSVASIVGSRTIAALDRAARWPRPIQQATPTSGVSPQASLLQDAS